MTRHSTAPGSKRRHGDVRRTFRLTISYTEGELERLMLGVKIISFTGLPAAFASMPSDERPGECTSPPPRSLAAVIHGASWAAA